MYPNVYTSPTGILGVGNKESTGHAGDFSYMYSNDWLVGHSSTTTSSANYLTPLPTTSAAPSDPEAVSRPPAPKRSRASIVSEGSDMLTISSQSNSAHVPQTGTSSMDPGSSLGSREVCEEEEEDGEYDDDNGEENC